MTTGNVRPADMERITTPELARKFIEEQVKELRAQIGDKKVLLALSGGVDSSVVAALLIKAVGKQLVSVHVNHGLLRKGEAEQVVRVFRDELQSNLIYVDAIDRFLDKLAGVADPEKKRKIIGAEFIRVFEEEARKLDGISFLAQGTIYPDIIESGPVKSHHNVGGLPEDLQFELVEPIKLLFKDEVRVVGKELGLPDNMVFRQPFPGPGLGVRCRAPSPATAWRRSARATPSCARNSRRTASRARCGNISPWFPITNRRASRTTSAAGTGRSSSVPSTPATP